MTKNTENPPLITTKLDRPKNNSKTVERTSLVQRVQHSDHQILLVLAPAGYGKTVFLSQLAEASKKQVVWYSLDIYDNEPVTFIRHLATALQKHTPQAAKEVFSYTTKPELNKLSRPLVALLVSALQTIAKDGALVFLDNWHVIHHPPAYELVSELIPLLPPKVQFVISGRNSLELPYNLGLQRQQFSGQVQTIDRSDLKFSKEELETFFRLNNLPATQNQLEYVATQTEGWPIAANFFAQSKTGLDRSWSKTPQALAGYIEAEILAGEAPEVIDFLNRVAVFSHFSISDCDQLLQHTKSDQIIAHLTSKQLFLDKTGDQYYLNPLLRTYLLDKLGSGSTDLYKRAGSILADRGDIDQAITCFLAAGDRINAAQIVVESGDDALLQGRWQVVGEWLDGTFNLAEITSHPRLSLFQAHVEISRGRLGHAQRAVNHAEALFLLNNDKVGFAECQLLQARISRGRGAMHESLSLLFDAEADLADQKIRLFLAIEKSVIFFSTGQLREAQRTLEQCLQEYEEIGDRHALAIVLEALGNVLYLRGECSRALLLFKRAVSLCSDGVMLGYNSQDLMSAIYDDWGETEQALVIAQRSLAVKEKMALTEDFPSTYIQLACIYTNLGRFAEAECLFKQGIDYVRKHDSDSAYLALNLVFLARTLSLQEKWVEARTYAEEALKVAKTQPYLIRTSVPAVAGAILARTGTMELGIEILKQAEEQAERIGFAKALAYCYQALASLYFLQEDHTQAEAYTDKALVASAKINDLQNFVACYRWYYPLLLKGLEKGTELTFVQRVFLKVGEPCLEHLVRLGREADPGTKERIIPLLLEIGGAQAISALDELCLDPDVHIRSMAKHAHHSLNSANAPSILANPEPALRLYMLGPLRIFKGEQEITSVNWRTRRARDLLIYLAHCGQPMSKDRIIEALWEDDCLDPEKATVNFHTTIYRLRTVLKQQGLSDMIQHGTETYTLRGEIETDLAQFDALLKAATDRRTDLEEQMALLESALQYYRGEYLEELDYDWVVPDREALHHRHTQARLQLINHYVVSKQFGRAIADLVLLLKKDSLNEDYHSHLMMAYAKSGQRQAAQNQYALLVKILQEELGVQPCAATQRLYRDLDLG